MNGGGAQKQEVIDKEESSWVEKVEGHKAG
jgi:hypothetical protein